ncbi:MAG: hypothetical protein ACE14W_11310, partial [Candidatus Velamenicoccus archaeovorus]
MKVQPDLARPLDGRVLGHMPVPGRRLRRRRTHGSTTAVPVPSPRPGTAVGVRRALAHGTARARRGLLARPLLQDALLGGALSVVSVLGALAHLHVDIPEGGPDVSGRGLDVLGASLVLLQTAPLALRRKAPVVVLGITTTAVFVASTLRYTPSLGLFGFLVAL